MIRISVRGYYPTDSVRSRHAASRSGNTHRVDIERLDGWEPVAEAEAPAASSTTTPSRPTTRMAESGGEIRVSRRTDGERLKPDPSPAARGTRRLPPPAAADPVTRREAHGTSVVAAGSAGCCSMPIGWCAFPQFELVGVFFRWWSVVPY